MKNNNLQNDNLSVVIFPRVSTEAQAEQGRSLEVQIKAMQEAADRFGGKIVANYGGQEHATPDFEHTKLEQLVKDSYLPFEERGWNAVMFYDTSRFSRDNRKASEYIETLKKNGIRFFTIGQEWNLFDPDCILTLTIHTATGQHQAMKGTKRSMESRIKGAEDGCFTAGPPPFGRKRDKATGKLIIIKKKKKLVELAAKLYLNEGKGFIKIAKILGMNASVLQRALLRNAGDTYIQHFKCARLGIDVSIPTKIPPLLDKKTIKLIQDEAAKRREYHPGVITTDRLLAGNIFCHDCGKRLSVQELRSGKKTYVYYRHPGRTREEVKSIIENLEVRGKKRYFHGTPYDKCDKRIFTGKCFNHVKGELIEGLVMQSLQDMLKDSKKFKEALLAPHPSENEKKNLEEELSVISDSIEKIEKKEENLINKIEQGIIINGLQKRADKYNKGKESLQKRKEEIEGNLSNLPTKTEIESYRKLLLRKIKNMDLDNLSLKQKRQLIKMFCQGRDEWFGRPAGIYVYQSGDVTELLFDGLLGVTHGIISDKDPDIEIVKKDEESIDVKQLRLSLSMNDYKPYMGTDYRIQSKKANNTKSY